MTPKPAPLAAADLGDTPETIRADASRRDRDERLVAENPISPVAEDATPPTEPVVARAANVPAAATAATVDQPTPLFPDTDAADFRRGWTDVQASFVDEPRRAVQQADQLVAGVMNRLTETFSRERASLEQQWDRGVDVTTEDLRIVMQRYRSFFDRLLSI
jgi:hypothetical protein